MHTPVSASVGTPINPIPVLGRGEGPRRSRLEDPHPYNETTVKLKLKPKIDKPIPPKSDKAANTKTVA